MRIARSSKKPEPAQDGKRGPAGKPGTEGLPGRDAIAKDGAQGPRGPRGFMGPMPRHEWKDTQLRFEQSDDEWGKWVDLQGPKGKDGLAGAIIQVPGNGSGVTELYDAVSEPVSPTFPYLRFERDEDGDVQAIYLGTET